MTNSAFIRKTQRGWTAKTDIELGNDQVLTLQTMKRYSGNITTHASVARKVGKHNFLEHVMYQDYSKTVAVATTTRCTAKSVTACHDSVDMDSVIAEVKAFYGI
jgi:hypothetical protein